MNIRNKFPAVNQKTSSKRFKTYGKIFQSVQDSYSNDENAMKLKNICY